MIISNSLNLKFSRFCKSQQRWCGQDRWSGTSEAEQKEAERKFKEVQSALELLTDSAESVFGRQNKEAFRLAISSEGIRIGGNADRHSWPIFEFVNFLMKSRF